MTKPNTTKSAPKVKWWKASRFESDSIERLAAGNSAANSNGQHQVPSTLGTAITAVMISAAQDTVASAFGAESADPDMPNASSCQLEQSVETWESASAEFGKRGWRLSTQSLHVHSLGHACDIQVCMRKARNMSEPATAAPSKVILSEAHKGKAAAVVSREMNMTGCDASMPFSG